MDKGLTDLRVFREAEDLSRVVWDTVITWEWFAKKTVGEQLVRAADSVGANIAEAFGRFHYSEKLQFLYYARGSLFETRFWLRQALQRRLLNEADVQHARKHMESLPISLNNFINSLKQQRAEGTLKESSTEYLTANSISQAPNLLISDLDNMELFSQEDILWMIDFANEF